MLRGGAVAPGSEPRASRLFLFFMMGVVVGCSLLLVAYIAARWLSP